MTAPIKLGVSKGPKLDRYKHFFLALFATLLLSIFAALTVHLYSFASEGASKFRRISLDLEDVRNAPRIILNDNDVPANPRNPKCSYWDCFNVYRCGQTGHDRIAVYVYPVKRYADKHGISATDVTSKEFFEIISTVVNSKYYTANPNEACIFVPSIDTLSQERLRTNITSQALNALPYWNNGENHLLFNMISGADPHYSPTIEVNTGIGMLAGADFDTWSYRIGFDVAIPIFSPFAEQAVIGHESAIRSWLVTSSQIGIDSEYMEDLSVIRSNHHELLLLDECHNTQNYSFRCAVDSNKKFNYPHILQKSTFCLLFRGIRSGQMALMEIMAANCIPVVVIDRNVMPFQYSIDWKRAAIFIMEQNLSTLMEVLKSVSEEHVADMQKQVKWLYEKYFSTVEKIVLTTLDIIQERVYPQGAKTYDDWNVSPAEKLTNNPLFMPITAPRSQGFTAVILTYDRVESLFTLIGKLSKVPSLMKILVIWNNQKKSPPPQSAFPQIAKPLKVIQTTANKLSNRFYPYDDIETEAILTIDDDIIMLTTDEVEFGYEVWREFPDRIVGFPSRTHVWDNSTNSWKYESEWTNEISMVLTGAAFMHKYWTYMYTTEMPASVRDWVDEHMNCEDIAMNFLVANVTNKPPIKATPRKKFKCPECTNNEMLSADFGHMVERSQCVDRFAKAFGRMPLKSVEFRADPVLFRDPFPEKLKRFNDIGSL